MWLTRRDCAALVLIGLATPSVAQAPGTGPLGLAGFDPVSYFLPEGPQAGLAAYEVAARGRTWRFAIGANRAAFLRDPDIYTPRLGGYDVAGILDGRLVDADPSVFAVIGDRLYLFRDDERRARIRTDPALAERAETLWPCLRRLTDGVPE